VRERLAYVLASDGHGGARAHTLRAGVALAVSAGASREQARRLTSENPRFLLRHGLAAGAGGARTDWRPWRAADERPITAARRARLRLGTAGGQFRRR
jgi:hypothetical protein